MNHLAELLKISAFGRKVFIGHFYDIKFRYKTTPELELMLKTLKAKYNHLYIHVAKTGFTMFGGRFHTNDTFADEVTNLMSKKEKVF